LERIYGYVFTAVARFKKLPAFSPVEVRAKGRTKKGPGQNTGRRLKNTERQHGSF
jgi:hypothetical protein